MTLVICTLNRQQSLGACLSAISAMEGIDDCQVVIVDNGSTDGTPQLVAACASYGRPRPFEYVHEHRTGLSHARNRGLLQSRGEVVIFTDDDCYTQPDFLTEVRKVFADAGVDYFGGRVLLHDPQDHPITIQESLVAVRLDPATEIVPGMIHGANMGFRRTVFEKLGGFNVLFGAGSALKCAEDTEMIARASAAGFAGGYFPGPTVRHHHRRSPRDAEVLMCDYDIGRGAFFAAMLGKRRVRRIYLRRWRNSFSWARRRLLMRELRGAARFLWGTGVAALLGRERVPKIPAEWTSRGEAA